MPNCKYCKMIQPPYEEVASELGEQSENMIYSEIDISKMSAFASRLKMTTAPQILFFDKQEFEKLSDATYYKFSIEHFDKEKLVKFISRYGNFSFSFTKTIPKAKLFMGMASVFGVMIMGALLWPFISKLLGNRKIWMALTVSSVLIFTSGHMFVRMRGMPEHGRNEDGTKQMIAPGFQSQYGYEARLVAMLCTIKFI